MQRLIFPVTALNTQKNICAHKSMQKNLLLKTARWTHKHLLLYIAKLMYIHSRRQIAFHTQLRGRVENGVQLCACVCCSQLCTSLLPGFFNYKTIRKSTWSILSAILPPFFIETKDILLQCMRSFHNFT